jgi:hypothetical protein
MVGHEERAAILTRIICRRPTGSSVLLRRTLGVSAFRESARHARFRSDADLWVRIRKQSDCPV